MSRRAFTSYRFKIAGLLGVILLTNVFIACGFNQHSQLNEDLAEDRTPVVLLHGGFGSCKGGYFSELTPIGMSLTLEFDKIKAQLPPHIQEKLQIIYACFGSGRDTAVVTDIAQRRIQHESPVSLKYDIQNRIAAIPNPSLYVVGHSWGGWSALKVVHDLAPEIPVRMLVTIDPISYRRCGPSEVAGSYFSSYNQVTTNPECTRAPSDISAESYQRIADRSSQWNHYYQTGSIWLQSGPINAASNNVVLSELTGSLLNPYKEHMDAAFAGRVWKAIYDALVR